jgi:hypothetical protein
VPFGIYDLTRNLGYVTVGISCNASQFAAACIERWWELYGQLAYPKADRCLFSQTVAGVMAVTFVLGRRICRKEYATFLG